MGDAEGQITDTDGVDAVTRSVKRHHEYFAAERLARTSASMPSVLPRRLRRAVVPEKSWSSTAGVSYPSSESPLRRFMPDTGFLLAYENIRCCRRRGPAVEALQSSGITRLNGDSTAPAHN